MTQLDEKIGSLGFKFQVSKMIVDNVEPINNFDLNQIIENQESCNSERANFQQILSGQQFAKMILFQDLISFFFGRVYL